MKHNIIKCFIDEEMTQPPQSLRSLGVDRILHRRISDWCNYLGSYGMGGPGFFGMKLAKNESFPEEWLILRLWGAGGWLLIDERWVSAFPSLFAIQKPLYNEMYFFYDKKKKKQIVLERWDNVSEILINAQITQATIVHNESRIALINNTKEHLLEIPKDTSKLPVRGGGGKKKVWNEEESQLDAWVITPNEYVFIK